MKIDGVAYRSITPVDAEATAVKVIDQRLLPWELKFVPLATVEDAVTAIRDMWVRGAPLIGATAAYGLVFAARRDPSDEGLSAAYKSLYAARPTAVNLKWALDQMMAILTPLPVDQRLSAAIGRAAEICDEDVEINKSIGNHGKTIIEKLHQQNPDRPVQIMTHCNTGWLATVDYGTALATMYMAHDAGIPIHVWVSETRPRNQGAFLTAYELGQHGVPYTVIADNAAGLLTQRGQVDMCIVGADCVTRNGDTCNKVGTYLKALACQAHGVPFYVALPYTTFDPSIERGDQITIENRTGDEVIWVPGQLAGGATAQIRVTPAFSSALNPAFDITPAHLITGYVTERGFLSQQDLVSFLGASAGRFQLG
jgi:methylthioribose-1-phosphate isomerase